MKKLFGFLRLMRPANLVTAVADILAGVAVSGFFSTNYDQLSPVFWLVIATLGLYGGGVMLNDAFDADLDRVERPERPIPSGLIPIGHAFALGVVLLLAGILSAFMVSVVSGIIALAIAVAAVVYDKWGKHHSFLGPLNMGLCRGLNLLLGLSIVPAQLYGYWPIGFVPLIYIAAITMISRGEVHGSGRKILYAAVGLYSIVILSIVFVSIRNERLSESITFIIFWAGMIFVPLRRAILNPEGRMIGKAVKAGVVALILMNAAWAAAFGMITLALLIALLLPLSILLARVFAVT